MGLHPTKSKVSPDIPATQGGGQDGGVKSEGNYMRRYFVFLLVVVMAVTAGLKAKTPASAHDGNPSCPFPNVPWDRPEGLLIKPSTSGTQYLLQACGKRPFAYAADLAASRAATSPFPVRRLPPSAPAQRSGRARAPCSATRPIPVVSTSSTRLHPAATQSAGSPLPAGIPGSHRVVTRLP